MQANRQVIIAGGKRLKLRQHLLKMSYAGRQQALSGGGPPDRPLRRNLLIEQLHRRGPRQIVFRSVLAELEKRELRCFLLSRECLNRRRIRRRYGRRRTFERGKRREIALKISCCGLCDFLL